MHCIATYGVPDARSIFAELQEEDIVCFHEVLLAEQIVMGKKDAMHVKYRYCWARVHRPNK